MIVKTCSKCDIEKELSEFNKQAAGKYGVRSYCRECQKKMTKAYKQTERSKELNRAWKKTDKGIACRKRYEAKKSTKIKKRRRELSGSYKERRSKQRDFDRFGGNREKALKRDEYKCVKCGSEEQLQVHHKDEKGRNLPKDQQNNDINNLITLCASCHIKEHNPVLVRWGHVKKRVMPS